MNNTVRRTISFLGVALLTTQLFSAPTTQSVRTDSSSNAFEQAKPLTPAQKEVERLLKQISANAATTSRHAESLESYLRSHGFQLASHATALNGAKEAINDMGPDFRRLQELRASALPWQQALIDRMEPVLIGMASETTEAIALLKQERRGIPSQEYRDSVGNLYDYADQARNLVLVNLDYAESREKLNRLDAAAEEPVAMTSPAPEVTEATFKVSKSLEQRVWSELAKLPYYGVFDHLAFQVDGHHVTLTGQVGQPTLKSDAERVVRGMEGVVTVSSDIEVLPLSPHDDGIRLAAYRAIYGHSMLVHYRLNPQPPIRIIVKNGNVTLSGVVGSAMERTIAYTQANGVPGAFSVTNHLQVGS